MVSLRSPWGTEDCYRKRKKGNFVEFTEVPEGVLETCGVHVVTKKRKSFGLQVFAGALKVRVACSSAAAESVLYT